MKICWLIANPSRVGLLGKVQGIVNILLLVHITSMLSNAAACSGCVHDVLKPTRGRSSQKYRLDFGISLESAVKLNSKVQFSTHPQSGSRSTEPHSSISVLKLRYQYQFNASATTKNRPKRYVEGGQTNEDSDGGDDSNSTTPVNGTTPLYGNNNFGGPKLTVPQGGITNETSGSIPNLTKKSVADFSKLFKPIRIKLFFDDKSIDYDNTSEEYERLNQSLQRAVEKLRNILSVIPVDGPLLFSRTPALICGNFWSEVSTDIKRQQRCAIAQASYKGEKCLDEFQIPEEHLRGYPIYKNYSNTPTNMLYEDGPGLPDADTVIYVQAQKTNLCNSKDVIAYATFCHLDQHNRPIAGFANFCPDYLSDMLYDEDVLYLTSLHEFFHALGFSKDLFDKFQDCHPEIVQKGDDEDNNENKTEPSIEWVCEDRRNAVSIIDRRKHIVTPAVRRETQKHFNCTSKSGCPLENHAVPPLTSSHWEARFLQGSIMAPTIGLPHLTVIDRITLGAFEDMGWYKVNYDHAENLVWGQHAGCDFDSVDTCFKKSSPYFCQRGKGRIQNGCHYLHLDKGRCETDKYLENCRIYKAHAGMECWRDKNETRLTEWKGEIYSHKSRCFISDIVSQTTEYQPSESTKRVEGRCYLHRCNNSETLEVQVRGSEWKVCPEGSYIKFDGYAGRLKCPSAALLCEYEFDSSTAPAVGPTSVTHIGNSYCAKISILFPKLAEIHYQIRRREKQPEVASRAQQKLHMFLAKFVNEIVSVTDIDETRIVDVKFISNKSVQFMLLKDLDWTTLTPKDPLSSLSPSDYDTANKSSAMPADPLTYNYQEVSCIEAVRRLLVSVAGGHFQVPVDGEQYKASEINSTNPEEETKTLQSDVRIPKEKPSRTGMLAAIAVGSVCGAMLVSVGVMIYWKSQVTTAVSPAPPTPTSADVRYQPNNGSTTVAPSQNGSFGELTFVA